ncbi:MAG: type II toxin-antitoxin system RelE/ParE family toxin [Gammaproteobacteria bacterium]|nr:type II toxin-antitoxin system RelE/ParE family toxin [Gammaproteobacteria bacterium]
MTRSDPNPPATSHPASPRSARGSQLSANIARAVQALVAAPASLLANPRIGEKLEEFEPREVRRILVGKYEMRYEIQESTIYVLRLWHTREDR